MNKYIILVNTPEEKQHAQRLVNLGYIIAHEDSKEIFLKKRN